MDYSIDGMTYKLNAPIITTISNTVVPCKYPPGRRKKLNIKKNGENLARAVRKLRSSFLIRITDNMLIAGFQCRALYQWRSGRN